MTKPLLQGADGITLTSTGLVAVREDASFLDTVLAGKATDKARELRLVMTLNHEAVHFIQCFTASFPYSFSLQLLDLSMQLMKLSRQNALSSEHIKAFREAMRVRKQQFLSPYRGISTIDLLEAMAVTEEYRASVPDEQNNASDFRRFLVNTFTKEDSAYRRVIDLVSRAFGIKAGYHLTPKLCYIALGGDHPAQNLNILVENLAGDRKNSAYQLTAVQILDLFGMDLPSTFLNMSASQMRPEDMHPVFAPYIEALSEIGSLQKRYEFCAQPGSWLRADGPGEAGQLVPPAVVFSGGVGRILGLAADWSEEDLFFYLDSAAMIGACLALLTGRRYYQACQHTKCPVHKSSLCHAWYAKPTRIPWTDCVFPKRIHTQFGASVEQLMKSFSI